MKFPCAHKSPVPKLSRVHTFILTHMGFLCKDAHTRELEGWGPRQEGDFWLHPPLAFRTERHHQCVSELTGLGGTPADGRTSPVFPLLQDLHGVQAPRLLDRGDAALLLVERHHGSRLGGLPR